MHSVPEAWHQAPTREFLGRLFESEPAASLVGNFPAHVSGAPYFLAPVAQYAIERRSPLWLVTFYGEPREKHVGAVNDEYEGIIQVYSLDPNYIDILAVKLPGSIKEPEVLGEAKREILKEILFCRMQQEEANVFHLSENGDIKQRAYVDGAAVEAPVLVANLCFDGEQFVGRAADELFHLHLVEKFDPAKPEAAYYRSSIGGAIPISPVTMASE